MGASVALLATALGSGELTIWPYISTRFGIGLLWLAIVGFTMQYFLNMEIERYTPATGETAVVGFTRFRKPWGIIFALGAFLPNAWSGWATGGATMLSCLFGLGEGLPEYRSADGRGGLICSYDTRLGRVQRLLSPRGQLPRASRSIGDALGMPGRKRIIGICNAMLFGIWYAPSLTASWVQGVV